MKKIISILLLLTMVIPSNGFGFAATSFDSQVPEFTAMTPDTANATTYTGYSKGLELIINSNFSDIGSDPYEEEIVRMAALGVAKQYGDKKYYPSQAVTGYEALGFLVRMMGNETAVMTNVYAQTGSSMTTAQVNQIMNSAYLAQAQASGIVTATETTGLNNTVTKEQLAVWTARAIGQAPVYSQEAVFSFNDWQSVNPNYRALIEALVNNGIMSVKNDGSFGPKGTVSRSEMASISKAALATQYGARGLSSGYGLIIGEKAQTIYNDGDTVTQNTYTVKNTDGTTSLLVTEAHTSGNKSYNFVTYKNGVVSDDRVLAVGDEVEYVLDNNEIKYVQVYDGDEILQKITASVAADIYSTFHYGTVSEIKTENSYNLGSTIVSTIYRVVDITGDTFDIRVDEDLYTGIKSDIVTYKNNVIGGSSLLAAGDSIEYLVNEDREVVYIKVEPIESTVISGTIREVKASTDTSPAQMTVYGYDDVLYTYPLAPYVDLTINSRYTELDNFVYGMNVTVNVSNGYVVSAAAESYSGDPGYIPQYGKMRIGTVTAVYTSSFTIKLSNGNTEVVTTDSGTSITKDGNVVSFSALKVGNDVKVYYDDIYSLTASKLQIEAPEVLYEALYKGKIKNISGMKSEIQLVGTDGVSNPQFISNSEWTLSDNHSVTLSYDSDTEFYIGNQKLTIDDVQKSYTGYGAYVIVKSSYGNSKIVKMSIKTGGETMYSSTVSSIDTTLNKFDISTKENFYLTDATIIIKDGLVVPVSEVSSRDTVFVVAESPYGTYYQNAMIVKVVSPFDDVFDSIVIGALEDVYTSSITLKNYTNFTNNYLNDVTSTKSGSYKLYSNTSIIDVTDSDNPVELTPVELFNGSYSRLDNEDDTYSSNSLGLAYDRYYAFMVVDDSDSAVVAMHIRQKGLLDGQNIDDKLTDEADIAETLDETFQDAVLTRGQVVSNNTTWDRLEITDSHDFTEYTGQWSANSSNIYIQYTDAIFIKDGVTVSIDDVSIGDYIYTMRIREDALVIFIES